MKPLHYIGVDVGTKSVRAAVVTLNGKVVAKETQDIQIWNPEEGYYLQSSEDIWKAVISAVKVGHFIWKVIKLLCWHSKVDVSLIIHIRYKN